MADERYTIEHDVINEQVLLAAACVDPELRKALISRIHSDRFASPEHQVAWAALEEIERKHLAFDLAVVQKIQPGLNTNYLSQLIDARPEAPPNIDFHVEALHWDHTRLEAIRGPVTALTEALLDPRSQPERVRALAKQVSTVFDGYQSRQYLLDPEALISEQLRDIRERMNGRALYPFGIRELDQFEDGTPRLIPGGRPKEMTIVTGTPGSGKSTVMARIVLARARQRRRVLYAAWEMNSGVTLEILAGMSLGLSRTRLTCGQITEEELAQVESRMLAISKYVQFLDNPFRRRRAEGKKRARFNEQHLDLVRDYIETSGCDDFVADLWQRCLVQTRPEDEAEALIYQHTILEDCCVHGFLVHQQRSKDIEQRSDKKPTRDGLKGSSIYLEATENLLGIHRPALWKAIPDTILEIDILKQRYGKWPLAVEFDWDADLGSITNGRSIKYDQPLATQDESNLASQFPKPNRWKGKK